MYLELRNPMCFNKLYIEIDEHNNIIPKLVKTKETDICVYTESYIFRIFDWLLGYNTFPNQQKGEGQFYWRKTLRYKITKLLNYRPPC